MRYLDTNVILRYLTRDDPVKAQACYEFFQRVKAGEEVVITCEAVIAEVVYVLASTRQYQLSRDDIRARLVPILSLKGLHLPLQRVYLQALDVYVENPRLDFEDALLVAHMAKRKVTEIYSYDQGFDKVPAVTRVTPAPPEYPAST
jgi:predicted nucleic acid-binding protein